jgi:hypothetical protein
MHPTGPSFGASSEFARPPRPCAAPARLLGHSVSFRLFVQHPSLGARGVACHLVSMPSNEHNNREGPWTKVIGIGTLVLVVIGVISLAAAGVFSGGGGNTAKGGSGGNSGGGGGSGVKSKTVSTPHAPFKPVYLDTLPASNQEGVKRGEARIGGHRYEHGLKFEVGYAPSSQEVSYEIPKGAHTFSAVIGNDDNQPNELWASIPLIYEVFFDERQVASGRVQGRNHGPPVSAAVNGQSSIKLKVQVSGSASGKTIADWGDPVFR